MAGRAVFVFSLANVANCFRNEPDAKIDLRKQVCVRVIIDNVSWHKTLLTCLQTVKKKKKEDIFDILALLMPIISSVCNLVGWPNERCSYYCFII